MLILVTLSLGNVWGLLGENCCGSLLGLEGLIQTPLYYRQLALSLGKESSYIFSKFNRLNTDTPLIRTLSIALLLSKSTGFDCIFECQFPVSLGCGLGHIHSDKIRSLSKRACVFKRNILHNFRGHPTSIFGKYVCCKISCLPASPGIFKHLKNGIIAHFYRIFTICSGDFFLAEIFEKF